jgi:hypothetical protein
LSTGRSVTPLRQPGFASVRDLKLPHPAILPFLPRAEIRFEAVGSAWRAPLLPGAPTILDLPVGELQLSSIEAMESIILAPGQSEGGFFLIPPTLVLGSPAAASGSPGPDGEAAWLAPLFLSPLLDDEEQEEIPGRRPRLYQVEAAERLASANAFLLADDAGTGKSASVCLALTALFRRREARRALIVCPKPWRHHWVDELTAHGPGLLLQVVHGDRRARERLWRAHAHILIADYQMLAEDIARGALSDAGLRFDVLVMDQLPGISRRSALVADSLVRIEADRRWGLAGALPQEAADWRAVFRLLDPAHVDVSDDSGLRELREKFLPKVLRRRKSELSSQIPRVSRQEVWLDLDEGQASSYREALAEERYRLGRLGGSTTLTHIRAAVERLQQTCAFAPESLDGPKVRAVLDLIEEILPAGGKLVVLSRHPDSVLQRLRPVFEAYGVVRLEAATAEADQLAALEAFRGLPDRRILLADSDAVHLGPLPPEASYVAHFDHDWNPAGRARLEARLFPDFGPRPPTNIYEFWMSETLDDNLHALLAERGALSAEDGFDAEGLLTIEDWYDRVLEVPRQRAARRSAPPDSPEGTAWLPGTNVLRAQLAGLEPERLVAGVEIFFHALGYGEARRLTPVEAEGGSISVERGPEAAPERLLVRCVRSEKNVGVAEGRAILRELQTRPEFMAACLVVTTDFTESLRKLADGSKGRLSLVSGPELYRHLHILGWI